MAISFNNISKTQRTPGANVEIDNSRALQGLLSNPWKVLLLGTKTSAGSAEVETIKQISKDGLADGFFGPGSELARMCNIFKLNNPNTELHAIALSINGGAAAEGLIKLDSGLSATADTTYYLMINGSDVDVLITSGWSVTDINSAVLTEVNANSNLPVIASTSASAAGSDHILIVARDAGANGNQINIRHNYYAGQSMPAGWSASGIKITDATGGSGVIDLDDAWSVIDGEQYQIICHPNIDTTGLASIEGELDTRFGPNVDLWGHAITGYRGTQAASTSLGNGRNSPHSSILAMYDSPSHPVEVGSALGAIASKYLNEDPARPLQYLELKGILPPPAENRFSRAERDILLYDGIATFITDSSGKVLIERCITTYQTNAAGLPDPSYLDIETLATLAEIRFQYKARMISRYIIPRFKLASNGTPLLPGAKITTPDDVRDEIIGLFKELQDAGLIEDLDDFIENLIVERNASDVNRVDALLPANIVNQFRILSSLLQFIL